MSVIKKCKKYSTCVFAHTSERHWIVFSFTFLRIVWLSRQACSFINPSISTLKLYIVSTSQIRGTQLSWIVVRIPLVLMWRYRCWW